MEKFDTSVGRDLCARNPNGGVIVYTMYWLPRVSDPDPEQPGEKLSIMRYLPTASEDRCPCGSGKCFADCCQLLPYWRPICPNPGMQGYSLMHPQAAHFTNIPEDAVYDFLRNDERLYCVEDNPSHAFWLYWGDPAFDDSYGTFCFGDFELPGDRSLSVTALSDTRMKVLLDLLQPLNLGTQQMQQEPFPHLEKPRPRASRRRGRRQS